MTVANDNEVASAYEVREKRRWRDGILTNETYWAVYRRGESQSISIRFDAPELAHRCMAVLIAHDRRRA